MCDADGNFENELSDVAVSKSKDDLPIEEIVLPF